MKVMGSNPSAVFFLGAGFQSKSKYMFGKVTIQIKLVEGDSAGTVTAFYVSISTDNGFVFLHSSGWIH